MIAQEVLNYKPSSETSPKSGSPRLKLYKGRSWIFRIFSQAMNRNFHNLNIIIRPCLTWEVTAELCLHFTQDGDWCQMPTFPAGLEDNRSFPSGSVVMSSAIHLQCWRHRRLKFYLWVRKIPWRREWQPTQDSCLKNPNGKRAWWATVTKSRTDWATKQCNVTGFYIFLSSDCTKQCLLTRSPLCIRTTKTLQRHLKFAEITKLKPWHILHA